MRGFVAAIANKILHSPQLHHGYLEEILHFVRERIRRPDSSGNNADFFSNFMQSMSPKFYAMSRVKVSPTQSISFLKRQPHRSTSCFVSLHVKNSTSVRQRTSLHADHMTTAKALWRKLAFSALPVCLVSY